MLKRLKRAVKEINRRQNGQVLIIMLIELSLGGIVLAPTLSHAASSIKHQQLIETDALELYAADAGVEDAFWQIKGVSVNLPTEVDPTPWNYNVPDVNERSVGVTIEYFDSQIYKVTSQASADGSSTTIESYIESIPGGELDIFSGALSSKGDITLGKDSAVSGDIYIGGELTYGSGFTHIPDDDPILVDADDFPTQAEDEAFAQSYKDEALLGGTGPSLDISTDTSLGPRYIDGDINVSDDIVLNLTGIVYVTGGLTASKDFTLTGTGSIFAEGDIYLSKIANFGTDGDSIIMSLYGNITFKKGGMIEALIYAPNGTIAFDKDATVIGGVVGADIQADKEGSFTYIPSSTIIDYPGELPATLKVLSHTIN